ncbi:hypothetical protein EBS43_11490 [bacterium]|nr:hypothetical protein [bacterium]
MSKEFVPEWNEGWFILLANEKIYFCVLTSKVDSLFQLDQGFFSTLLCSCVVGSIFYGWTGTCVSLGLRGVCCFLI